MNNPSQRPYAQPVSDEVAWRLLDNSYADPSSLWSYLILLFIIGGIAIGCMRDVWSVVWACSGVCFGIASLLERRIYPAHKVAGRLALAQRRFMLMSILHGAYWGLANFVLLLSHNPFLQFWVINAETAVLALTVARLSPMAKAIKTQVVLSTVPATICCVLTGNVYYQGFAVLVLLYLCSLISVIEDLKQQTVRLMLTEEKNAAMLQSELETNARLDAANRRLEAIAITDGLTGIPNRRRFDDAIRNEWDRALRAGTCLSVLLIDIDNFKIYNDTLGHLAGDSCLREVAKGLAGAIRRPADLAARFGGEEFAVIITDTDHFGTNEIAERLRAVVEDTKLPTPSGGWVTVSIGAALSKPAIDHAVTSDEAAARGIAALIAEADANLYEAKRAGRNCVRAS